MMNRINKLFRNKNKNILSIYFTAGFPGLDDTAPILEALQDNGIELVEIGIPFSDPMAEGPPIQKAAVSSASCGSPWPWSTWEIAVPTASETLT